jgi:hypothetical protein
LFHSGFGAILGGCLTGVAAGCLEAVSSAPEAPLGPDHEPPVVALSPAHDTVVAASGELRVVVAARDRSLIGSVELDLDRVPLAFPPATPLDTVYVATYLVPLSGLSGQAFGVSVRAADVLGNSVVTPTVTVRVR